VSGEQLPDHHDFLADAERNSADRLPDSIKSGLCSLRALNAHGEELAWSVEIPD
jgi:hypothetical protein